MTAYLSKTDPFDHQRSELADHGLDASRGLFWEQGTGKTKPVIDTTAKLYRDAKIDGLLVIAPNGVHANWVSDEIPTHMDPEVLRFVRSHIWYSTTTKKHQRSFDDTLKHSGLAVLVMSYDAVRTPRGKVAWKKFLNDRKCMYVLDESHFIKNPGAKTSKRVMGSIAAAPFKRILTGTPIDNNPFDLYNQLRFLDPEIWYEYGIRTFAAFKQYFGIWESITFDGGTFPKCIAYKNLNKLHAKLHQVGSRVTKDEALDLPPKLYSKRYVELTPLQRRLYNELKEQCYVETATGEVTASIAIVRLLRFQQIICGYLPKSDDDEDLEDLPGINPRLNLAVETVEDLPHQAIIWARFQRDIDLLSQHKSLAKRCVAIDGRVTGQDRAEQKARFTSGEAQFLITSAAAMGTGHTLNMAKTVVYYNNTFKLGHRLQSEDRCHRIGQTNPVNYIDLVARNTVDVRIVDALRRKQSVATTITGDTLKEWI